MTQLLQAWVQLNLAVQSFPHNCNLSQVFSTCRFGCARQSSLKHIKTDLNEELRVLLERKKIAKEQRTIPKMSVNLFSMYQGVIVAA